MEVRFDGETAWLSLGQMAELFQRDKSVISRHIKNVFEEGELDRTSVVAGSATTAFDGKTYQRIEASQQFFKTVQNKMHWAAHGHTAAEIVAARADATRPNMGLTTWDGRGAAQGGRGGREELPGLRRARGAQPHRHGLPRVRRAAGDEQEANVHGGIAKLDDFLKLSDREILHHAGRVSHDDAVAKAELEYGRFAAARAALPAPVEKHFEEAVRDAKQLEKARRASKSEKATAKVRKKP